MAGDRALDGLKAFQLRGSETPFWDRAEWIAI